MAKAPDDPNAPRRPKQKPARDPAKHSKKDPARPTRAKAARPEQPPMEPALADLLNPGIGQGTAGPGSQTGLKPPADNSFDRRADFSAAHRARKSTAQGLGEAPQTPYRSTRLGELDPDLAKALGIHDDDSALPQEESAQAAARDPRRATLRGITGATATVHALAAQLYGEFKSFFPDNAVEYFVSYYDYYQPEAYVPRTDTYIEKESSINEQIDRMRHSATRALLERDDVIIVASVSCIYGIGSVETYTAMTFTLKQRERIDQRQLIADLVALQYKRSAGDFYRGLFRVRGDVIEIFPAHYEDRAWRVSLFGDEIESIHEFDPLTGAKTDELEFVKIYANSHYVTPRPTLVQAIKAIKFELRWRLDQLNAAGRLLEAQ